MAVHVHDLRNPDRCPDCGGKGAIVDSRPSDIYRMRRRKCKQCGRSWRTYESLINPEDVRVVCQTPTTSS